MADRAWSNIAVVGAGALGSYFGAMLARGGKSVTLIGRKPHVDAISRDGLLLHSLGHEECVRVAATTDIAAVSGAPLVLFCVKSLDTEEAVAEMAPHLGPTAVILSLQNGVDNPERIRRHIENQVIPVLVYAAANIPSPGHVAHTGGGNIVIGHTREFRGKGAGDGLLGDIAAMFTGAGVPVRVSDDIEADLWTKLVMNCAYNAISALGGVRYGQMVAMAEIRRLMCDAVAEVVQVASAKDIRLPDSICEMAIKLADAMPHTLSSTAQDIARGRPTEIDHLNGYVVRQGEVLGIATPVNRALHALMKLIEQAKEPPPAA